MPQPFIYVTPFLQQSQGTLQTMTAFDSQIIQPGEKLPHYVGMPQPYVE